MRTKRAITIVFAGAAAGVFAANIPTAWKMLRKHSQSEILPGYVSGSKDRTRNSEEPRYAVPFGNGPHLGSSHPRVVAVIYGDLQDRITAVAVYYLKRLMLQHPEELQLVYKHFPRPFNVHAQAAAEAVEAARSLGKFWPMVDRVFSTKVPDPEALAHASRDLALDVVRFDNFIRGKQGIVRVGLDQDEGFAFGVERVPTVFVNGRMTVGLKDYEVYSKLVEEELEKAARFLALGGSQEQLYHTIQSTGIHQNNGRSKKPLGPSDCWGQKELIGKTPLRVGEADAPVQVVLFGNYNDARSRRVSQLVSGVVSQYARHVSFAWKNVPTGTMEEPDDVVALAAWAAQRQGKFDVFHRGISRQLPPFTLEKICSVARSATIDVGKLSSDIRSADLREQLVEERRDVKRLGVTSPVVYINERRFGVSPYEAAYRTQIDVQLALAALLPRS